MERQSKLCALVLPQTRLDEEGSVLDAHSSTVGCSFRTPRLSRQLWNGRLSLQRTAPELTNETRSWRCAVSTSRSNSQARCWLVCDASTRSCAALPIERSWRSSH